MFSTKLLSIVCLLAASTRVAQSGFIPNVFSLFDEHVGHAVNPAHNLSEAMKLTEQVFDGVMQRGGVPSLVFGISIRGKTIQKLAKGFIDIENQVKANINAAYRMASVSKTFTSILIGTLVDAGKVKYEDSIYKFLPPGTFPHKSINGKSVDITVGQVLSNMAGLHATNITDFFNVTFPDNSTEALRFRKDEPLYFEPGTDWVYSNYGFEMLGAIIEFIEKRPFPDVMDAFLKNTLRMSSSEIERITTMHPLRPRYYRQNVDVKENIPVGVFDEALLSTGIWAAGGLLSTVDDLLKYGNLIIDSYHRRPNAIIKRETLNQIWTPRTKNLPNFPLRPINEYGYGFMIAHMNNTNVNHPDFRWHSGGLVGATTFLTIYPEEEIVAVAMSNKGSVLGSDILCIDAAEMMYEYVPK